MKYIEDETSIALMKLNVLWKINSEKLNAYKKIKKNSIIVFAYRLTRAICTLMHIRKYGIKVTLLKSYWWLNPSRIKNYELKKNIDFSQEFATMEDNLKGKKIVVYSAVFGGYDTIKEPLYINDNIDYVIFTDQELADDSAWKKYNINEEDNLSFMDSYHKSKYVKIHPEEFFPDYDYSVWVDGNILIVADILPLVMRMSDSAFMATFDNPYHDDIYTEARFCVFYDAVSLNDIRKQINDYRKEGFPDKFGMREFSLIVRKHNDVKCISLMKQWWEQLNIYTMRDQISFPYVLWRNGMKINIINVLGENWRCNPRLHACEHEKNHIYDS